MDDKSYSRLLSYIVCEMTMPIKKHVYNFAVSDQTSVNPLLLSATALTTKTQILKDRPPASPQQMSRIFPNGNNINMSGAQKEIERIIVDKNEIQELCEGTEIEKSALGDIYFESRPCKQNEGEQKSTDISPSLVPKRSYKSLDIVEDNDLDSHSETKRCYTLEEDNTVEPTLIEENDGVSNGEGEGTKCLEAGLTESTAFSENYINGEISDAVVVYQDSDFRNKFRMSRSTFQVLIEILSEEELEPIEDLSLDKKVMIVLWLLGTSGSHSEAAQEFGVSEEAVASCFFDICATLYNKSENFIKWPSSEETDEISSRIEKKFGFPGVVGVLGYHYFTISIPKETLSRREHFNGKLRMYCVGLQIVCDNEFIIRDIFPGLPGGIRPAQVLRDSPLGEILATQATQLIDSNKHILARSDFPQLASMLTPYVKNSESLTMEEEEFNDLHENVCLVVDQTFQMLKDRFRILKLLDPEVATMVLVTTCVLHNICIQNGDTYDIEETV